MNEKNLIIQGVLIGLLIVTGGCQVQTSQDSLDSPTATESDSENSLILENATLEHSDEQGRPLWKIRAKKAIYSKDQKDASLEDLTGELFQDGEVVLQVEAKNGSIKEDAQRIFLKNQIVAVDPRNQGVITGEEVEWNPQDSLLIIRKNLQGKDENLIATAEEGTYQTRSQQLELVGKIVATMKDPSLHLTTERLWWDMVQKKVSSDRLTHINRYQKKVITDRLKAEKTEINLKTNLAMVEKNVELKSLQPKVQISTNFALWNYKTRLISSDKPLQIIHHQEQITVTGNRGKINFAQDIAQLSQGTQGISRRNQANLYAEQLIWNLRTQKIQGEGNVIYTQADPKFRVTGENAVGKLQDDTIVVTGGSSAKPVVTNIIP